MRDDTCKDIIKICKGFYNEKEYDNALSALKAYQSKVCGVQEKYITYDDVLNFGLFDIAEKYFTQHDWIEMLKDRLWKNDILFKELFSKSRTEFDGAYICNLLIRQICCLRVKDNEGNWIIDLSGYENEEADII